MTYKGRTIEKVEHTLEPHYLVSGLKNWGWPYEYARTLKEAKQIVRDDLGPDEA